MSRDIDPTFNREEALQRVRTHILNNCEKMIWVTFQKEGIHHFPDALQDGNFKDVKFLGYPHRHIFKFKVWIQVYHDDRDIEFIQFKRWLESLYNEKTLALDNKSCEMISDDLYEAVATKYPDRHIWIEVSEDGENGSFVQYDTHPVARSRR